jgi:predicted  nucleic acid-binding Zn-ribbon protein
MDIGKAIDDNTHGIFEEIRRRSEPIERSVKHLEARIDTIEATMAAKDDISALKNDFSALKTTQDEQGKKLDQILHLLQSKQ